MDEGVFGALAEARALGFLGPGPLDAHVTSAEAFAQVLGVEFAGRALDLGSGGGVPGLLLAARYPTSTWVLLDQHRRRTSFLARVVAALGWVDRVKVVRAAAEAAAHDSASRGRFDAVTARSFAPPALTAEVGAGFLRPGGMLIVAEPPDEQPERWPLAGLQELGLRREPAATSSVAVLRAIGEPNENVPRAWRTMERRPRW